MFRLKIKIKRLLKSAKQHQRADEIYLAPDPDREGEIIAWHVEQEVKKVTKKAKIHRITFNEITKSSYSGSDRTSWRC